jgi:hypothetical protein
MYDNVDCEYALMTDIPPWHIRQVQWSTRDLWQELNHYTLLETGELVERNVNRPGDMVHEPFSGTLTLHGYVNAVGRWVTIEAVMQDGWVQSATVRSEER